MTTPVQITDDISPGVVSIPHGWGHGAKVTRMNMASQHPGVNTNILSPGDLIDTVSGNAVLNGIPVTVEPATVKHSRAEPDKAPHDISETVTSIDIIVGSAG